MSAAQGEGDIEVISHRRLGLHERLSVARTTVGAPPILAYGARLAGHEGKSTLVHAHLARRIDEALRALLLLSCAIQGATTREPRFASSSKALRVEDVLLPVIKAQEGGSLETLLQEAVDQPPAAILDLTTAPLWEVRLVETSDGLIVLLIVHHVICDGIGTAKLLELLLSGLDLAAASGPSQFLPEMKRCGIPTTSDQVVKPSLRYTLWAVWNELLIPRLPSFIRSYVQALTAWPQAAGPANPAEVILAPPLRAAKTIKLLSFPHGTIAALKRLARDNGVKTLQPVLNTVCAVATYAVARQQSGTNSDDIVRVSSSTAMNLRSFIKDEGDHTTYTGNFVGSIPWRSSVSPEDDFWAMSRSYADLISSDHGRTQGRYGIGVLAYLSDPPPSASDTNSEAPTGWEAWLLDKAGAAQPFHSSFGISNLGKVTIPAKSGVVEVAWALRPPVIGPLFAIDVCGLSSSTDGGRGEQLRTGCSDLTMTIGWNHGALSEDGKREQVFVDTVKRCIEMLADDGRHASESEPGERTKLTVRTLVDGASD